MRQDWSKEVYEMRERLKPYFKPKSGGIRDDSPEEIKQLYQRYYDKVMKEKWK